MNTDAYTSISATIGGCFIGGLLIGYALKKADSMSSIFYFSLFLSENSTKVIAQRPRRYPCRYQC